MARSATARPPAPGYRVQVAYTVGVEATPDAISGGATEVAERSGWPVWEKGF